MNGFSAFAIDKKHKGIARKSKRENKMHIIMRFRYLALASAAAAAVDDD